MAVQEDEAVRHAVDVCERAHEPNERNDLPEEMKLVPFGPAEDINDHVNTLVDMMVDCECASVLEDTHRDWFDESDHYDKVEVRDAFDEITSWLAKHHDAAEAAGIDVDDVWGTRDGFTADEQVAADV